MENVKLNDFGGLVRYYLSNVKIEEIEIPRKSLNRDEVLKRLIDENPNTWDLAQVIRKIMS